MNSTLEINAMSSINPVLIELFHGDLPEAELNLIASALAQVPGDAAGRSELWGKFKKNQAVILASRNTAGQLAAFAFYEVRVTPPSSARDFFIEAGFALEASRTLVETSFPQYESYARARGCQSISFRTSRPGLVKKVLKMEGWELQPELVYGERLLQKRL